MEGRKVQEKILKPPRLLRKVGRKNKSGEKASQQAQGVMAIVRVLSGEEVCLSKEISFKYDEGGTRSGSGN